MEVDVPGPTEDPKRGSEDGGTLAERQEELNESVATGEDEDGIGDEGNGDSLPASDPPSTY